MAVPGTTSVPLMGKQRLEDGVVGLLLHEQRDVLEGVAVIEAEAATDDVVAVAFQVIGKTNARAEVLGVVSGLLGCQLLCQGVGRRHRQQLLEGAAVGHVHAGDHVEVPVITEPNVHSQPLDQFPIILEIQAELLGAARDDEGRIAVGDAHPPYRRRELEKPFGNAAGPQPAVAASGATPRMQLGFFVKSISSVGLNSKNPPIFGFQM